MAVSAELTAGYLPGPWTSTESSNTIGQFTVVFQDTTTPYGVVRPDNANANSSVGILGVNVSTGVVSAAGVSQGNSGPGVPVQPGNPVKIATRGRIEKVLCKSGVTITQGQKVYVHTADTGGNVGAIDAVAASGVYVGMALESNAGGTADIIPVWILY